MSGTSSSLGSACGTQPGARRAGRMLYFWHGWIVNLLRPWPPVGHVSSYLITRACGFSSHRGQQSIFSLKKSCVDVEV